MHPFFEILSLEGGPVGYELSDHGNIKLKEHTFPWSIRKKEFDYINNIVKTYNLKRGYECATAFGVSAMAIGLAMKETGGKLVTMDAYIEEKLDSWAAYRGAAPSLYHDSDDFKSVKHLIKHFGLEDTVFPEVGWSPDNVAAVISKHFSPYTPEEKLDFVFIDGGHFPEQLIKDIESFLPFLAEKNIIMFHDVYDHVFDKSVNDLIYSKFGKNIEIVIRPGDGDNLGILNNFV